MTDHLEEGLTEHEQADLDDQQRLRVRELLITIDFGLQVEAFLKGALGQRLLHDSERERLTLMEEAVRVDCDTPEGNRRHRELRQRVAVLDHWQEWFAAYIKEGNAAQVVYQEGEVTGV